MEVAQVVGYDKARQEWSRQGWPKMCDLTVVSNIGFEHHHHHHHHHHRNNHNQDGNDGNIKHAS
ncbi:hypothetical protein E2C01_017932 [Portunus trituberculatus]|uniref:Uncharacterized protein n=1 Tax=Portunus trituberculatus TaxID=210409 RepID=A0A5B7DTS6_PORTR|nr:hypothetical protein [Portunus trituberculatus]